MNEKSIRILHIFSGVGGGISTWIRKAVIYSDGKYTIDAMAFSITDKSSFKEIIESKGGKCYQMPRIRDGMVNLLQYVVSIVKNGNYDLIHCHIDGYGAIPFWLTAHVFCKKPLIIHSHRTAIEKIAGKGYEKIIYGINRFVNRLISKNKVACGEKAAAFAYGNSKHIKILHNGIDPVNRDYIATESNESCLNIVALGRLNRVKNHEFMIRVSQQLKSMNTQFHLFIVGDGELKNSIYEQIYALNLSDYISMEGYCDTPSFYLEKCDVLIMPSFSEGLPTVMLEAQEYGCKVISSDRVTKECDLDLGLVTFMQIEENDIIYWAREIIKSGKKRINFSVNDLNEALLQKGFINKSIYHEYYEYIRKIVEE